MKQAVAMMVRFVWAHLRRNTARSVALLGGVLVATTGFTVLTATTATARLTVTGTVDANARAAYDILVRPKGARTPLELDRGLVRPNYLSGLYGGVSMQQYQRVRDIPGVDVAAPIAMVGYANGGFSSTFDITDLVDRSARRQLIRVDPTFSADRGSSRAAGKPSFVYVVTDPVAWPDMTRSRSNLDMTFTDGTQVRNDEQCGGDIVALIDRVPICAASVGGDLTKDTDADDVSVVRLLPDGRFERGPDAGAAQDRLTVFVPVHLPLLLAAVDPEAEDRLVGLGGAVDAGRYLKAGETVRKRNEGTSIPVLSSDHSYVDSITSIAVSALPADAKIAGIPQQDLTASLSALPTRPLGARSDDSERSHRERLAYMLQAGSGPAETNHLVRTGPTEYDVAADGTLVARTVPANPEAFRTPQIHGLAVPWQIDDTAFRTLTPLDTGGLRLRGTELVGTYDPARLTGFSELSKVPLETYEPPGVVGADARTRDLLGGKALVPDGNPGGYVASPPLLLTDLALVPDLLTAAGRSSAAAAPISAIRVRVAGLHGYDAASRERVRLVAEQIAADTGLDVDITFGSSTGPQRVQLAAGGYGRPALTVEEQWSRKGVATVVVNAVDRKSAILFLLVLVVCALFLANAVAAAVRGRTAELAVLACLGWPRRRIGLAVLGEVLALGLAAGVLGLGLSAGLGALLGVRLSWTHALLALPVALGLALAAGGLPALRASRARPAAALRAAPARAPRARRPRGVAGLGLVNLGRTPGRTLLGAAALAVGVAGLTVLAAATYAFNGAIVGTVLGDAVSVRVRGVDAIAVAATVVLGALAVADVLYINVRDRAAELAALRATGWTDAAVGRLVVTEGLGIGVLGAVAGAALGLTAAALLVGDVTPRLATTGAAAAVAGALLAGVAALIPALTLRRRSTARLLAAE